MFQWKISKYDKNNNKYFYYPIDKTEFKQEVAQQGGFILDI